MRVPVRIVVRMHVHVGGVRVHEGVGERNRGHLRQEARDHRDEATDEALLKFVQDSAPDQDLAVSAFLAKFGPQPAEPAPKAKAK